jgi:hypothetical protein
MSSPLILILLFFGPDPLHIRAEGVTCVLFISLFTYICLNINNVYDIGRYFNQ